MRLFLVAIAGGLLLGWWGGGTLGALATLRLRGPWLLPGALATQLLLGLRPLTGLPAGPRFTIIVMTYVVAGAWLAVNARTGPQAVRAAMALFAVGWAMNLVVMVPNGGMPVSPSALKEIGLSPTAEVQVGYLSKHVRASGSTTLAVLADVIPAPALRSVLSVGDLVMALGLSLAVAGGMRDTGGMRHTGGRRDDRNRRASGARSPGPSPAAAQPTGWEPTSIPASDRSCTTA